MAEHRFFIEPSAVADDRVELSPEVAHHIGKVLRLAEGDEILLLDGSGNHFRTEIDQLRSGGGSARIVEQWHATEKALPIRLIQALPKGEKFDLILQKGTELGIGRFSPVSSGRSIAKAARTEKKLARWRRIVAEAARQSRRPLLPTCDPVEPFGEAVAGSQQELKLMLWEEGSMPLAEALPAGPPTDIAILVGPEGGFSADEAEQATGAGFIPVSLGPRILRTETAGFAVAAVLEYLYGDFGANP